MKRLRGLSAARWVLLGFLLVCAATAVVALAARSGIDRRPENYNVYEPYQLALGFPCVLLGAYIAWRAPRQALGWLFVAAGWAVWLTPLTSAAFDRDWIHNEWIGRPLLLLGLGGWVWCRGTLLVLVPLAYPGRRLAHARARRPAIVAGATVVVLAGLSNGLPTATMSLTTGEPAGWTSTIERLQTPLVRALFVCALLAAADLVIWVIRTPRTDRFRHLPFVAGGVLLLTPSLLTVGEAAGLGTNLDSIWAEFVPLSLLPIALAVGVLRHDVLGFDTIVRRSTVYAGVTAVAAALYVAVVWTVSAIIESGTGVGPILATGFVAVSFQPVRAAVQTVLDRTVFGDRDEPYRALAGLGQRLRDAETDPLTAVAEVVRSSLRLAAVSIEWDDPMTSEHVVAALAGTPTGGVAEHVAILFEGRQVANLNVTLSPAAPAFTPAERRLLSDLAGAAGAVVQAAVYADEVAHSRGLIVRAREEERRRLRHDLHDGLGPTLAGVAMGLDAAAHRLDADPELSGLLRDLDEALQEAITDIRRLVAGLRPPALDDLGLLSALQEQALDLSNRSRRPDGTGLTIHVAADDALPEMAAAVEVAAYRIAVEAMTNTLRHAEATECRVRLLPAEIPDGDAIEVVVEDDGRGLDPDVNPGVGLESMRNRAEELGGWLRLTDRAGGGTILAALLPLQMQPGGIRA